MKKEEFAWLLGNYTRAAKELYDYTEHTKIAAPAGYIAGQGVHIFATPTPRP